jgi:TDG/mug DNA glycosylase family protein
MARDSSKLASMPQAQEPTRAGADASYNLGVADIIAPDLKVLFCGINPSPSTAAIGHHFAGPGNRFWQAIHEGGFTDRRLSPSDDQTLPEWGCGITNIVARPTAKGKEVYAELKAGILALRRKVRRYRLAVVAFLGIEAYCKAFNRKRKNVILGQQTDLVADSPIWVLPNPSKRNRHYQRTRPARTRSSSAAGCSASTRATRACSNSSPTRPAGASRSPRAAAEGSPYTSRSAATSRTSPRSRCRTRARSESTASLPPSTAAPWSTRLDRGAVGRWDSVRPHRGAVWRDHLREGPRQTAELP